MRAMPEGREGREGLLADIDCNTGRAGKKRESFPKGSFFYIPMGNKRSGYEFGISSVACACGKRNH